DRGGAEGGDGVLVEVGGHGDLRRRRAELVELLPHGERLGDEVAGVEPHRAELPAVPAGGGHRALHAPLDVVGVDEQRRARPHGAHLGVEGRLLVVVDEGEGAGGGADGRDPVGASRLEHAGADEAADDGGPRGGDGGLLVGAARPHLQAGPAVGGGGHPGGGGGDGAVVVEDGEHDGLQEERLGEGAAHGEDG